MYLVFSTIGDSSFCDMVNSRPVPSALAVALCSLLAFQVQCCFEAIVRKGTCSNRFPACIYILQLQKLSNFQSQLDWVLL